MSAYTITGFSSNYIAYSGAYVTLSGGCGTQTTYFQCDWSPGTVQFKLKEALEYIAHLKEQREALRGIISQ